MPDGRLAMVAKGNLNPSFIIANLEILKKKLVDQLAAGEQPMLNATAKVPDFQIRRMP